MGQPASPEAAGPASPSPSPTRPQAEGVLPQPALPGCSPANGHWSPWACFLVCGVDPGRLMKAPQLLISSRVECTPFLSRGGDEIWGPCAGAGWDGGGSWSGAHGRGAWDWHGADMGVGAGMRLLRLGWGDFLLRSLWGRAQHDKEGCRACFGVAGLDGVPARLGWPHACHSHPCSQCPGAW